MAGDDTESSTRSVIDITSPYFLTSADHPGLNFVGDNLLRDGNYSDWKSEITNAFLAKNKMGFIDGTIPMPKEGSKDLMNWQRCNAMVRGWLVSSMEKEIKNSVKYATTARYIWIDLEERFNKENAPRAYELRITITMIHQESLSVSAYYTKLRGVWDEMQSVSPTLKCTCSECTCDVAKSIAQMRDKEKLYNFLMGLNEEYGTVRTQILSRTPLSILGAAFHLVNQDEQQRHVGFSRPVNTDASAFQTKSKNMSRYSRRNYNQSTYKRDDRNVKTKDKTCTYCQKFGHTIDGCFDLIGYPEWWTKKANNPKPQSSRGKTQATILPKAASVQEDKQIITTISKEDYDSLMQLLHTTKGREVHQTQTW
ncbi:uncharacterized protein [Rutidosis leptorrhynchoides]|uniref:uncharacterized protein n=1 Tax=Rutidosis leptorrhynchoides TaxID=125765 RepID=UPI003A9A5808